MTSLLPENSAQPTIDMPITIELPDTNSIVTPTYSVLLPTGSFPSGTAGGSANSGTFVATRIREMFSFIPTDHPQQMLYEIGLPVNTAPIKYKIRNDTVSTSLKFTFTVPEFLTLSIPPDVQTTVTTGSIPLPPAPPGSPKKFALLLTSLQESPVTFSFVSSSDWINFHVASRNYHVETAVTWDPQPLNVTGPVLVYKNLPPLELEPPTPIEGGTPPPPPKTVPDSKRYLYMAVNPADPTLISGKSQIVNVEAWIGDKNVSPHSSGSTQLQFAPNSIQWKLAKPLVAVIDAQGGGLNAIIRPLFLGTTDYTAKIVSLPLNISVDEWNAAYNANTEIKGGSAKRITVAGTQTPFGHLLGISDTSGSSGIEITGKITTIAEPARFPFS